VEGDERAVIVKHKQLAFGRRAEAFRQRRLVEVRGGNEARAHRLDLLQVLEKIEPPELCCVCRHEPVRRLIAGALVYSRHRQAGGELIPQVVHVPRVDVARGRK